MKTGKALGWAATCGGLVVAVILFFLVLPAEQSADSGQDAPSPVNNEPAVSDPPPADQPPATYSVELPSLRPLEIEVEHQLAVAKAPGVLIETTPEFKVQLESSLKVEDYAGEEGKDLEYAERMARDLVYPILQLFAFGESNAVASTWALYSTDADLSKKLLMSRRQDPDQFEWKKIQLDDGPAIRIIDPGSYLDADDHPGDPFRRHLARAQKEMTVVLAVGIKYNLVSRDGTMFSAEFFFAEDDLGDFQFLGATRKFKPVQAIELGDLQNEPPK